MSTNSQILKYFWIASLRPGKKRLILFSLPISAFCLNTLVPFLTSTIIASLSQKGLHSLDMLILLLALAVLAGILANRVGFLALAHQQAAVTEYIENETVRVLMLHSAQFYNNTLTGKLVSDAIDFPRTFIQLEDTILLEITPFLVSMIAGIIIVSGKSPLLGFIIFVMATTVIATAWITSKKRAPFRTARHAAVKEVNGHIADILVNNQNVKTFTQELGEIKRSKALSRILRDRRIADWVSFSKDGNNRIAIILSLQLLFVLALVRIVHQDSSLLGIGIFAFTYTISLSNQLFRINGMIRTIETVLTEAAPMIQIIHSIPDVLDKPHADILKVRGGRIDFQNVWFRYNDNPESHHIFQNLSFSIKQGEKVGVVGQSGVGKTTITRLLLRFEDIQDGKILIDNQEVSDVTQHSLRAQIAYVPQEPLLFHRSIRENISYGKPEASIEEIIAFAKKAHAQSFIEQLPHGYDTLVGERGVKLSGGQRQRVAIARAMLKNAPILLLDEATSALDSESEELIQDALWKLMEGRTAIVVAHRLSTIQKMDRILVMEEGKIVEQGSHRELIRHGGVYASLWSRQSGGFLED